MLILYTVAILLAVGAVAYFIIPDFADWLDNLWAGWFKDSETILWARVQMFGGAVLAVLITFDFASLFAAGVPKWQQFIPALILFGQGVVTEYARRRREDM